jgi:hypothetical protein
MKPLHAIILFFVAWSVAACSSSIRVTVRYASDTNDGRPLYLMVRSGQVDNLSSQPYDEAADMVFAVPRDASVEKTEAILPGHEQISFYIKKPEDADLVVYFFFTRPRAKWLYRIPRPIPSEVEIVLGDSEVLNQ